MHCKVCGDTADGITLKCRFTDGPCRINGNTRKYCTYCRLVACVRAGMKRKQTHTLEEYILNRQQLEEKRRTLIEQKYKCAQLVPLDLLRADRSSLTVHHWSVLSNITHVYDPLFEVHKQRILHFHTHDHQKPIKARLKLAHFQELASTYCSLMMPFLEHIPDYQSLHSSNRLTLIHHNMITLTEINSHYMSSTTKFIPHLDKNYAPLFDILYGNEAIIEQEKVRQNLDTIFHVDPMLIKLVLVIFTFSNVIPCLSGTSETIVKSEGEEIIFSKAIFRIQNNYADVLWRYMLFRFRQEEFVIRIFSNIIYNCLEVQNFSHRLTEEHKIHGDIFDRLTEEIERK